MLSGCNIGTPGVMIDLEKLGKKYMPNLRRAEDWGLWMLYLKDTDIFIPIRKLCGNIVIFPVLKLPISGK